MDSDSMKRLATYVEGFFPSTYEVDTTMYVLEEAPAPLVTITVLAPSRTVASHDAYLHEVLDVSYMAKVASYLLQIVRTGPCVMKK